MLPILVVNLVTVIVLNAVYGLVPLLTHDTLQYGVRVPPAHTDSPAIAAARRGYYRLWLVLFLVTVAVTAVLDTVSPPMTASAGVLLATLVVTLLLNYGNYFLARRRLLTAKETESWYKGVVETIVADTAVHRTTQGPSLAWGIPNLAVTLCAVVIPALRYQSLPATIAVHFNAAGMPDSFATKSFGSVFGSAMTQVVLFIALVVIHLSLGRFSVRLNPANPGASRARYSTIVREGVKAVWVLFAFINAGTLLMLLPLWGIFAHNETVLGIAGTVLIFCGVAVCILWMARAAQGNRHVDEAARKSRVVARDDDRYWIGGMFYFNTSDSGILVPKRFGVGVTFNFGHPVAWILLLAIVAAAIVIPRLVS